MAMDRDCGRACGNFTFILKLYCEMKGRRKTSFYLRFMSVHAENSTFLQAEKNKKGIDINGFFCYTNYIPNFGKSKSGQGELWKKS